MEAGVPSSATMGAPSGRIPMDVVGFESGAARRRAISSRPMAFRKSHDKAKRSRKVPSGLNRSAAARGSSDVIAVSSRSTHSRTILSGALIDRESLAAGWYSYIGHLQCFLCVCHLRLSFGLKLAGSPPYWAV